MVKINIAYARPLLTSLNIINKKVFDVYSTSYSYVNFAKPQVKLMQMKNRISFRGPTIWNNFLSKTEKELEHLLLFSSKVHSKLMKFDKEIECF